MIPTMIIFGLIFGRWWLVTLAAAAVGWPLLLVATSVAEVDASLIGAAALAIVNAGIGVLVHQGFLHGYRHLRRPASNEVMN